MKIELEAPVTEYCRDCNYEAHRSFYSHLASCPECKGNNISGGLRLIKGEVKAYRTQGRFNICSDETSFRYVFNGLERPFSFVIEEELDTDDIFNLIEEMKVIIDGYILYGKKPDFDLLYETLTSEVFVENQEYISKQNRIMTLKRDLYKELSN